MTRSVSRSLCDSWASCCCSYCKCFLSVCQHDFRKTALSHFDVTIKICWYYSLVVQMYNFAPNPFVVPIKFNKNRHLGRFTNFTSLTLAYENIYKMSVRIPVMTTTLAIKFSSWYHKTRYNYVCYCDMCLVWSCYYIAFYNSCERFSCICRI